MENQKQETEILRKEISELRQRMLGDGAAVAREDLPPTSIGRTLGTIGTRFKALTKYVKR